MGADNFWSSGERAAFDKPQRRAHLGEANEAFIKSYASPIKSSAICAFN